jgi:hypothetical protein
MSIIYTMFIYFPITSIASITRTTTYAKSTMTSTPGDMEALVTVALEKEYASLE